MPRGDIRDTSPAGNTITHSSRRRAASIARTEAASGRPPRTRTGSSNSRIGSIAARTSLATMRTSRRTRPTASSRAKASIAPEGWLATITRRPRGGMRARSAASTA